MQINRNRVVDGATWRPPQRVIRTRDERGVIREVIEKIPGVRSALMLKPSGTVCPLPLGNANARAEDGETPYKAQKYAAKTRAGWLPWGRCPIALVASETISPRHIQCEDLLDPSKHQPCTGGGFGPQNPCPHALIERDYRKARHEEREAAKAEAHKREADRDRDQRERHHEETIDALRAGQTVTAEAMRTLAQALMERAEQAESGGKRK